MNVQRFRVYMDTDMAGTHDLGHVHTTHDLAILPVDRMRAERESSSVLAPSQRGENASALHPNTWLMLWLWCSATRQGITSEKFPDWSATVLDFDRVDANGELVPAKTPADQVEAPQVDPTNRAGATT